LSDHYGLMAVGLYSGGAALISMVALALFGKARKA